jgi:peroxiredoxin
LRDNYDEIKAAGGDVVAIGTGDAAYARAFVEDERIPFLVLIDDDAVVAKAVGVRNSAAAAMNPLSFMAGIRARRAGHRQRKMGTRPFQMGATFVIGPGPVVRYEHLDRDPSDHAPLDQVISALKT